ncbi:hypothetical protein SDRG_06030 [Saprolegnia diclina VS20]|uniref:Uncharacterized protein n=1 Tax=Saprolegnia diclina (strain VS20) TaxID=1156394 RepID=T0QPC5_SAPDV|nr:hypothetical protein SDRG_06030 [Saprolegnia diclina VS20]EQC36586.1 hypothetical protein SDRG_06030 [Saprolegnia diclina VS20]|eukprot:XP_008610007.1 hypothetical protein SDRG_06030 [Saprolegnia diclina VS20]
MLTPADARARTTPLPDGEELIVSPGLRFDAFAITNMAQSKTFFKAGCAVCPEASLALTLHETSGHIQCLLPDAFWTSHDFTFLVDFASTTARTHLHLVHCIYLGDQCIVESFSFGAIEHNVAYRWLVEWMNPFSFLSASDTTQPTHSDVFYFDNDTLLAHHRVSFQAVPEVGGHRENQLFDALEARALAPIRTALHHLARVPQMYKLTHDVLFDLIDDGAIDIARLLVDHGATLSGTCSDRLLTRALDRSDIEMVSYALDHGANVQSTIFGQTQLQRMVLAGNDAMVDVLVNAGAYVGNPCDLHDHIDRDCSRHCKVAEAPLVAAYTSNQPRMAQLLLDLHAPIDVAQKAAPRNNLLALCLLHVTDQCARRWHIQQLLERGAIATIRQPNQDGVTPYALATSMNEFMIRESFDFYTKATSDAPQDDNAADVCGQNAAAAWRLQTSTSIWELSPRGSTASSYEYDSDAPSSESDGDWTLVDDDVDMVH